MKTVIFFDWDGTLCDSMELCIRENRMTLEKMGLPAQPEETLRACNGPTYREAVPILGVPAERTEEYCRIRLATALSILPEINRMYDGAREMLLTLQPHADMCIVSNSSMEYLQLCLRTFGLEGVFSRVAAAQIGRTKTQNLAALLNEMRPERAVMIGDRLGDIAAGADNGLLTIACDYGYGSPAEWERADYHAASVQDLEAMLQRFAAGEPMA